MTQVYKLRTQEDLKSHYLKSKAQHCTMERLQLYGKNRMSAHKIKVPHQHHMAEQRTRGICVALTKSWPLCFLTRKNEKNKYLAGFL